MVTLAKTNSFFQKEVYLDKNVQIGDGVQIGVDPVKDADEVVAFAKEYGVADMLASSLTRAIFFSSLTTGVAFGSLWLSNHPGTASMGKLLTLSLFFTLLAAFVVVPAFLGPPKTGADKPRP